MAPITGGPITGGWPTQVDRPDLVSMGRALLVAHILHRSLANPILLSIQIGAHLIRGRNPKLMFIVALGRGRLVEQPIKLGEHTINPPSIIVSQALSSIDPIV